MERSKKFGFTIVFMSPNLRITSIMPSKAEGNILLRKKQYSYDKTEIASHVIANKIHNQTFLLKKRRKKTEDEKEVIKNNSEYITNNEIKEYKINILNNRLDDFDIFKYKIKIK